MKLCSLNIESNSKCYWTTLHSWCEFLIALFLFRDDYNSLQDSFLVLQTSQRVLCAVITNLEHEPFMNVEVVLRVFYMLGEMITDKVWIGCLHPTHICPSSLNTACLLLRG